MLEKMERRFGKYAIPGLMKYIIICYVIGYLILIFDRNGTILPNLQLEPYMIIHHLQLWRLISWLLIPPSQSIFFAIIMCIFYYQLGRGLEQMWGAFKFNLYMFSGIIFTIAGAFILYGVLRSGPVTDLAQSGDVIFRISEYMGPYFSTSYINMSIFLAFSLSMPDMQVMLYFILPIKMRWLALVYAGLAVYSFVVANVIGRVSIISSLLNFLLFFLVFRGFKNMKNMRRQQQFRRAAGGGAYGPWQGFGRGPGGQNPPPNPGAATSQDQQRRQEENSQFRDKRVQISRHRCSVCGKTEITNPGLEFRFCSKCNGNYEYCNEHLFTHKHVE